MLVALYDRRLHLRVEGEGRVTVLLDGDEGAGTGAWEEVARGLARVARVVRYDRAGYGRSDPAPGLPTADDAAQDLHAALAGAGVGAPYLLVGHGCGASVARLFAHRYRREVTGMVLLDPWPERFAALAPSAWRRRERLRLARRAVFARLAGPAALARYREAAARAESDREVAALPNPASLPLVVVRHDRPDLFAGLPAADADRAAALWRDLQEEIAGGSVHGRLCIAEGAGHDLPGERPLLAVRAVRELLDADVPRSERP